MNESGAKAVGFIGLGLMGSAFSSRLVECGYAVKGFDIDPKKVEAATLTGVVAGADAADVVGHGDITLMCVTSTAAVEEAVFGNLGVVDAAAVGKVLVDHSTSQTAATVEMAGRLRERTGMQWVDAPVSGGPPAAAAGKLAIMAGGDGSAIEMITPLMNDLAARFTHMGEVGAGQITKMVNQVLVLTKLGIHFALVSPTFGFRGCDDRRLGPCRGPARAAPPAGAVGRKAGHEPANGGD